MPQSPRWCKNLDVKTSYLKDSDSKSGGGSFFLLSLALHGGMLALLFVPLLWDADLSTYKANPIIEGFNVELVDVTMDNVRFDPKDFEKAKVVRKKIKKAEESTAEKNTVSAKATSNLSADAMKVTPQEGGDLLGTDHEDREGAGTLDGETKRILMSYKDYLSNYLNNSKQYPRMAEKLRQEGMVVLVLEIDAKGLIKELKIKQSSNYKTLDVAAINHVRSLSPFKELPGSVSQYRVEVPIVYKIN